MDTLSTNLHEKETHTLLYSSSAKKTWISSSDFPKQKPLKSPASTLKPSPISLRSQSSQNSRKIKSSFLFSITSTVDHKNWSSSFRARKRRDFGGKAYSTLLFRRKQVKASRQSWSWWETSGYGQRLNLCSSQRFFYECKRWM